MKLSQQLILLITLIFMVIFSGNFAISLNNIRDYLQLESHSHAQDTATSLGLSISPYSGNLKDPIIETMMNAIFDRGYYKEIIFVDPDGKELIHLENTEIFLSVPTFFKRLITMEGVTAKSRLSNGWNLGGTIIVRTNPGYAYYKLYEQAKSSLLYAVIAFLLSMVVVLFFLKLILKPLKNIERLAARIARGKFDTIKELPWTTEIRNVAISMNFMSKKIKQVIAKLNTHLDQINNKLKRDPLTQLEMKPSFITALKQAFVNKEEGFVVFVKIDDLASYAKEHNGAEVEYLIKNFGLLLYEKAQTQLGFKVFHFFGAEFAILARDVSLNALTVWLKSLQEDAQQLIKQSNKPELYHMGIASFDAASSLSKTLAAADLGLEQAKLLGKNTFSFNEDQKQVRNMDEWHELVVSIIDAKAINIDFVGSAITFEDEALFMKEVFTKVFDEKGEVIPIGTFVSLAEKYEKIIDLDKTIIAKVIEDIQMIHGDYSVAINLSMDSIKESAFRTWLFKVLSAIPEISNQLVFTLTAYGVAKDIYSFKSFVEFVHRLNAKVMIKRFESESIPLENVKDLDIDYIRLAREYTENISHDSDKEAFVEAIKEFGDLLHIIIFAEGGSKEDATVLKKIGIYGVIE